jgi:glycosyltransferase involved in cell wall biosynthesis
MKKKLPALSIILSTHASIDGFKKVGMFYRYKLLFQEYSRYFEVFVYSSDAINYSKELGIVHYHIPWIPKTFGWHHLIYYLWLVWKSPMMKGVIKVFGSNIPTLPIVKLLSDKKMVVTYQWDYANTTRNNESGGLKHWLPPILEKLAMRPADRIFVTTESLQGYVQRIYAKPTILIPNWVDLKGTGIFKKKSDRDKTMILFAGRLVWSKGVDVLLAAFVKIKHEYAEMRLVICGDGEEREKLEQKVDIEEIPDVEFRGVLPNREVLDLMQQTSFFVLPTINMEGHPKALVEAMASGAFCIGSDVPGIRDVIKDGVTGLLVKPNDPDELFLAIKRLIMDNGLWKEVSEKARSEAEKYDFNFVVQKDISELLSMATD